MDIKHLITFKTIAQLGSFTKASQVLNYSQSTLTIHIQTIEKELAGRVFDRIGRHIAITTLGNELLPLAAAIIANYEKIEALKIPHDHCHHIITLGMQESVALYRLQPLIKRFQKNHPQVTLIQVLGHKSELTEKLLASELDAMCVMQRRHEQAQLESMELVEEKMGIVGNHSSLHSLTDLAAKTTVFVYPKHGTQFLYHKNKWFSPLLREFTFFVEKELRI